MISSAVLGPRNNWIFSCTNFNVLSPSHGQKENNDWHLVIFAYHCKCHVRYGGREWEGIYYDGEAVLVVTTSFCRYRVCFLRGSTPMNIVNCVTILQMLTGGGFEFGDSWLPRSRQVRPADFWCHKPYLTIWGIRSRTSNFVIIEKKRENECISYFFLIVVQSYFTPFKYFSAHISLSMYNFKTMASSSFLSVTTTSLRYRLLFFQKIRRVTYFF